MPGDAEAAAASARRQEVETLTLQRLVPSIGTRVNDCHACIALELALSIIVVQVVQGHAHQVFIRRVAVTIFQTTCMLGGSRRPPKFTRPRPGDEAVSSILEHPHSIHTTRVQLEGSLYTLRAVSPTLWHHTTGG